MTIKVVVVVVEVTGEGAKAGEGELVHAQGASNQAVSNCAVQTHTALKCKPAQHTPRHALIQHCCL